MNRLLFILLFLSTFHLLPGQKAQKNFTYRKYTTHDGLVQIQSLSAYQDDDGYIWFGTKGGVSRFDGQSFKNFTKAEGFKSKVILRTFKIENTVFFIQNFYLSFLLPNGKIHTIPYPPDYLNTADLFANALYNDKTKEIYLFNLEIKDTDKKPCHLAFSLTDSTFREIPVLEGDWITAVSRNTLWGERNIYQLKDTIEKICTYEHKHWYHTVDSSGTIAYAEGHGSSYCIKLTNNRVEEIPLPFPSARMHLLPDGRVLVHDNKSKEMKLWDGKQLQGTGIFITLPTNFITDREGNTWVLSEEGIFNLFSLEFEEYRFRKDAVDNVWNILEDPQGNMWFGGYQTGLWMMDKDENISYPKEEQFIQAQKKWNNIYHKLIAKNKDNAKEYLWLTDIYKHIHAQYMGGCVANNKLYFPFSAGTLVYENGRFDYLDSELVNGACFYVYHDKEADRIIAASPYFTNKYPHDQMGIVVKDKQGIRHYPWPDFYITSIEKDWQGRIRLGSYNSEAVWTGDRIVMDTVPKPYRGAITMKQDSRGALWKGTTDGLFVETAQGIQKIEHERLNIDVVSLLNYNDKYLLIGCGYNLLILDLDAFHQTGKTAITLFDYNNGYKTIETCQNGFFQDSKGNVWLANSDNVIKVNPGLLMSKQRKHDPKVLLTDILFSSDNIHFESIIDSRTLLKPNENTLRFEYFSSSFSFPQSLRFRYRLKGLFDDWSEPQHEKQVVFTSLSPGDYRFEVQSSIDGENWSAIAFSPQICIQRPFWATWWFALASLALFTAITVGITRRNQHKRTERLQMEKDVNDLKLKNIRSKSIPHFSGNILSAISYMSMNNYKEVNEYIGLFSDFVKQTLRDADKAFRPLSEELEYVRNYLRLEKLRFGTKFDYEFSVSDNVPSDQLIPNMLLHTYCENAIKHGLTHKDGNGYLKIEVYRQNDFYIVAVEDNGIGREEAMRLQTLGTGEGLMIIVRQINLYNKSNLNKARQDIIDLKSPDGNACGTRFEFWLPINFNLL